MKLADAWALLGLEPTHDRRRVREAYLLGVRVTHPDVSTASDAHERTAALRDAYESVLAALDGGGPLTESASAAADASHDETSHHAEPAATSSVPPAEEGRRRWRGFRPDLSGPVADPHDDPIEAAVLTDDTITIAAPANEALPFLIEACNEIGDVTFLDRRAGIVQVTVGFVDEPVCYLMLNLQGRATGVTEVFCSIESIEAAPAPPIDAVTRLLVETLDGLVW